MGATIDRERRLRAVRDAMLRILAGGHSSTQRQLLGELLMDDCCGANFRPDPLYVSIGAVVRTFNHDFYRDPSTGRISLTARALEWQRAEADKHKRAAIAGHGTASARIADAIEAREAVG